MELSCQEVQEILSSQLDGESTLQEDKLAEAHLVSCSKCSAFAEQMESLSFVMLQEMEDGASEESPELPELKLDGGMPKESRGFDPQLFVLLILPALQLLYHLFSPKETIGPAALLTGAAFFLSWRQESKAKVKLPKLLLLALLILPTLGTTPAFCSVLLTCLWLLKAEGVSLEGTLAATTLAAISLEASSREQPAIHMLLQFSEHQNTAHWIGWSLVCLLAGTWSYLLSGKRVVALLLFVACVSTSTLVARPLYQAYQDYLGRVAQLPTPKIQKWRFCLSSPTVVEVHSQQLERWNAFSETDPRGGFPVRGRLWSAFHVMDGRKLVIAPWPQKLKPRLDRSSAEEIQEAVEHQFTLLDREIESLLDGSIKSFLLYSTKPRPVARVFPLDKESIEVIVPEGTYLLGFEQLTREQPQYTPGWNQIVVRGETELEREEGYYTPNFVWAGPRNFRLEESLEGWDHNGEGSPLKPGALLKKMFHKDRPHSMEQSFLLSGLGAQEGDEVRVTAFTEEDYEHATLVLYISGLDGDTDFRQTVGTGERKVSMTIPVRARAEYLNMRFGHRKIGDDIKIRGFLAELVRDGRVIRSEGLQSP